MYENKITTICPEIGQLVNLQVLELYDNKLTTICPEIGQLVNLRTLNLPYNKITTICPEICQLVNLQKLDLSFNKITTIYPEIGQLFNLQNFNIYGNEIEYMPPNVQRILDRQKNTQNIYNDNQNVHNHYIQESFRKSVNNLIKNKPTITYENILEDLISNNSLAIDYITEFCSYDSVHQELNLTFKELFIAVYQRIICHEHKKEILKLLEEEMKSAECKCFTGRVTRLVNCLCGFEEDIVIKIADNEQIGNVIAIIRNKFIDDDEFKKESKTQLLELRYTIEIINEWLDNI